MNTVLSQRNEQNGDRMFLICYFQEHNCYCRSIKDSEIKGQLDLYLDYILGLVKTELFTEFESEISNKMRAYNPLKSDFAGDLPVYTYPPVRIIECVIRYDIFITHFFGFDNHNTEVI